MDQYLGILLIIVIFVVLMVGYFLYLTRPKGSQKGSTFRKVEPSEIRRRWAEIQAMMREGGPANYRQAIMEADKLIDMVLKSKVRGETMGERLKNARNLFPCDAYDKLWTAHKIRNKIAHEADFEGLSSDAQLAVRNFERALRELRVI